MDTLELTIELQPKEPWSGILIAELSELGCDGFLETKKGIVAYGPATLDVKELIQASSLANPKGFSFKLEEKIIPYQNWNAQWESDFEAVYIEDMATIVAPFHDKSLVKGIEIVIEPQMSFGTGHHQTTWLMSRALLGESSIPERLLDMGAGTGVLAILAEKLGVKDLVAVDIEEEAKRNIEHNCELNASKNIKALCGDIDVLEQEEAFGLILANINKNVLKTHMKRYAELTLKGGQLWLSGFFESDVDELLEASAAFAYEKIAVDTKEGWALIRLLKKN